MSTICSLDAKKPSAVHMSLDFKTNDERKKSSYFDSFLNKDATVVQMQQFFKKKTQTQNNSPMRNQLNSELAKRMFSPRNQNVFSTSSE